MNVEAESFAGLELHLPDPHKLVFEQNLVADFAQRDAALGRRLEPVPVGHESDPIIKE